MTNVPPKKTIWQDIQSIIGGIIGGIVPWWVWLIIALAIGGVLYLGASLVFGSVTRYMKAHDDAIAAAATFHKAYDNDELKIRTMQACAALQPAVQQKVDAIAQRTESAVSANVSKHEEISNAIVATPASSDAVMAPVLSCTFVRLYEPTSNPVKLCNGTVRLDPSGSKP